MASLPHTTAGLANETPSTSETATGGAAGGNLVSKDSTLAADVSNTESKVGVTSNQNKDTTSNAPGSAEVAAEKLYEERIEEEYAKQAHQRIELQNIVRNRFWQARHDHSTRRLRLLFEAGYEGIDHLDAAVAGEEESKSYILDLLQRASTKVKQPRVVEYVQPLVAKQRSSDRLSLFDRPLPLEQLKGKRHVPVLFNAQGIPVLRIKKPQPESLSGYINHRLQVKQKRHDTRHRLEEELELARAEDNWDEILRKYTGETSGQNARRSREVQWSEAPALARREISEKLNEERRKNQIMAEKMQAVVDREQALFDKEKFKKKKGRSGIKVQSMANDPIEVKGDML